MTCEGPESYKHPIVVKRTKSGKVYYPCANCNLVFLPGSRECDKKNG